MTSAFDRMPTKARRQARVRPVRPEADQEHRTRSRAAAAAASRRSAMSASSRASVANRRMTAAASSATQRSRTDARLVRRPPASRPEDQAEEDAADQHAEPQSASAVHAVRHHARPADRCVASGPDRSAGGWSTVGLRPARPRRWRRRRIAGRPGSSRVAAVIRSAAWPISGIWRGSGRRPGSATPST